MATPRAHLCDEGGGIVTGTLDVKEARRLIVAAALDNEGIPDYPDREDVARMSRRFRPHEARQQFGRIVPVGPNSDYADEYAWFWRPGYRPGKPGVTKAVVWS